MEFYYLSHAARLFLSYSTYFFTHESMIILYDNCYQVIDNALNFFIIGYKHTFTNPNIFSKCHFEYSDIKILVYFLRIHNILLEESKNAKKKKNYPETQFYSEKLCRSLYNKIHGRFIGN